MNTRSYSRGHRIVYRNKTWVFADTGEPAKPNKRPCGYCNRERTPEGHDGCLGTIPGARYACCGHGTRSGYVMWDDRKRDKLPVR